MKLTVNLEKNSYPIYIENHILADAGTYIKEVFHGRKIMIVSDDNVYPIYGDALSEVLEADFEVFHLVLPHGEATKKFESLPLIYDALLQARFSRSDLLIALGGGVIGDLAGFAAASFLRGIKLVQIPTSLLAQVDSSVGGKVAVDLPQGKNLVGAFKQPVCVLCDPDTLRTLPNATFSDGMGEVVKYGMIRDAKLFELLAAHNQETIFSVLEDVICTCISIKRDVVEADEFDTGERMILNYGHTLGHAIEGYYHYETYSHGSAVAIGMCLIAEKTCTPEQTAALKACLQAYHLPTSVPVPISDLLPFCGVDKKRAGNQLRYIVCETPGKAEIRTASISEFAAWMEEQA